MKQHFRYLRYVARHKWFVLLASFETGVPLLGLLHDLSKFRPGEWLPYARSFYGGERTPDVRRAFDYAWDFHQKRNKHHWQHWVLMNDSGEIRALDMPYRYMDEALADWYGAGRAQATKEKPHRGWVQVRAWWEANNHRMTLSPLTRAYFEMETLTRAQAQHSRERVRMLVP